MGRGKRHTPEQIVNVLGQMIEVANRYLLARNDKERVDLHVRVEGHSHH